MYCEVFSVGGSKYEIIKNHGKSKQKTLKVIFKADEGAIRCVCSMFEYNGIFCRHAIAMLSHNRIKLLHEKYIIRRWIVRGKILSLPYKDLKRYCPFWFLTRLAWFCF